MILPIYPYGNPVLRAECEDITGDTPELQQLIEDMIETMHGASGIGLAAPQIGKNLHLFVVDISHLEEDYEKDEGQPFPELWKNPIVFINPEITDESETLSDFEEGCLSIPDIREVVTRPTEVQIRFLDRHFKTHDWRVDRLLARVIQHEYDHIEGILFVDHLSAFKRRMLRRKLQEIARGNIETDYKML